MNKNKLIETIWLYGLTGLSESKFRFFLVEILKTQQMTSKQIADLTGENVLYIESELKSIKYLETINDKYFTPPPSGWSKVKIINHTPNLYTLIDLYRRGELEHYQKNLLLSYQEKPSNIVRLRNCG